MANSNFIPLRTTSQYSLLEGALKIEKIVEKAVSNKMPAVG